MFSYFYQFRQSKNIEKRFQAYQTVNLSHHVCIHFTSWVTEVVMFALELVREVPQQFTLHKQDTRTNIYEGIKVSERTGRSPCSAS